MGGGDCVAGGQDLTVASVEDGKVAAESIHATLTKRPEAIEGFADAVLSGGALHAPSPLLCATAVCHWAGNRAEESKHG